MEGAVTTLLCAIGEDPSREGLLKTPERVAKSLAFLTSGADKTTADVLNGAVFTEDYDQMVLVKDIEFYSLCEHHMLPFFGKAHIAYLPAGRVVGLSELPRLLEVYARRLQIQERLTQQLAWAIQEALRPRGAKPAIECECARGPCGTLCQADGASGRPGTGESRRWAPPFSPPPLVSRSPDPPSPPVRQLSMDVVGLEGDSTDGHT